MHQNRGAVIRQVAEKISESLNRAFVESRSCYWHGRKSER